MFFFDKFPIMLEGVNRKDDLKKTEERSDLLFSNTIKILLLATVIALYHGNERT